MLTAVLLGFGLGARAVGGSGALSIGAGIHLALSTGAFTPAL